MDAKSINAIQLYS